MARICSLLFVLSVVAPPVSLAQEQRSIEGPAGSGLWALGSPAVEELRLDGPAPPADRLRVAPAPDHRWEGLVAGATLLGVAFAVMTNGLCRDPDGGHEGSCLGPTVGAGAAGATIGGVVGGLLGSLIPKPVHGSQARARRAGP
jgi:hypothetical protein